jgi:DNA-binding transcriptional MerR regulator
MLLTWVAAVVSRKARIARAAASVRKATPRTRVSPDRAGCGRVRTYSPVQVRDARVIHQLRTAGYRIPHLRAVLRQLPDSRYPDEALHVRDMQLTSRSHPPPRHSRPERRADKQEPLGDQDDPHKHVP